MGGTKRALVWSNVALARLLEIRDGLAEKDPRAAGRILRQLLGRAAQLVDFPNLGRAVPELPGSELRELIERERASPGLRGRGGVEVPRGGVPRAARTPRRHRHRPQRSASTAAATSAPRRRATCDTSRGGDAGRALKQSREARVALRPRGATARIAAEDDGDQPEGGPRGAERLPALRLDAAKDMRAEFGHALEVVGHRGRAGSPRRLPGASSTAPRPRRARP